MAFLACKLEADAVIKFVVTRRVPSNEGSASTTLQTLVVTGDEGCIRVLTGASTRGRLDFGQGLLDQCGFPAKDFVNNGVWDPFSGALYLHNKTALFRVESEKVVLVAGDIKERSNRDGSGDSARFRSVGWSASDGEGSLYLADGELIRRLDLPSAWRAESSGFTERAAPSAATSRTHTCSTSPVPEAVVTTLATSAGCVLGLAYDADSGCSSSNCGGSSGGARSSTCGSLVYATETAVYRLPLRITNGRPAESVLLAGKQGTSWSRDGRGNEAGFCSITGLVVDGDGCVYVSDHVFDRDRAVARRPAQTVLRKVTGDGHVSTIDADINGCAFCDYILPNGCLALAANCRTRLLLIDLGVKPGPTHAAAASAHPSGPPRSTLPADLGALLERQPDGTADLEVVVGEQAFRLHRALLSSRCDYFRRRLEGGFADGAAAQLILPDADPEAFALLLRFIYTGAVDIPAALAQAVAALADRLLLPELCRDAQAQVLAAVRPGSVVGAMLWAESRGAGFAQLLADLKAWYLTHQDEVLQQPASLKRLMAESPDLMLELHQATMKRSRHY